MRKLEMPPTAYGRLVLEMLAAARISEADRAELADTWFRDYPATYAGQSR